MHELVFSHKLYYITCLQHFLHIATEAVDDLMGETHELGGSTVVVDRATPKVAFRILFVCFSNSLKASCGTSSARLHS